MIRINLLAVERERSTRRLAIPVAHRVTLGASLIILVTLLGMGWWYWALHQESARLDADITAAERETQALRSVLAQVQTFETRRAQLQQRVSLIEQLRRGQSGPVHAIDEVSKAIPDRLWLTEIVQKGDEFSIAGLTTSLSGLSDFVANLEASPWFRRPIDIIDSQVEANQKAGEIFKFSIRAGFETPEAPASAPAAGTPTVARVEDAGT
ncbi:MAG: PilN domain-containing protein [Acidobacteria bacterium]|nr:PilN domain-containing protein [Acidobacteriota bacterium]MBA3887008.1 PilN domain-containing protein [Acidobacteriota bacterium]